MSLAIPVNAVKPSVSFSFREARWAGLWATLLALSVTLLAPVPANAATVQATLSWNTPIDLDLHVWDAAGNHAWYGNPSGIPGATLTGERAGTGEPETFTETADTGRSFIFGVCFYSGNEFADGSLEFVDATGTDFDIPVQWSTPSPGSGSIAYEGSQDENAYQPPSDWCEGDRTPRESTRATACDTDSQSFYATYKGKSRLKVTQKATACAMHLYNSDGTSCAVLTSFNAKVSHQVTKLGATVTKRAWNVDGSYPPRTIGTGCNYIGDNLGLLTKRVQYTGKYSIVRKFRSDPIAQPKLMVRANAGDASYGNISEVQRENLVSFEKISVWKYS